MEEILAHEIIAGDIIEGPDGASKVADISDGGHGDLHIDFTYRNHCWAGVPKGRKVFLYGRVEGERELERLGKK